MQHSDEKNRMDLQYREEKDTLGSVKVPADAYYGAQTTRSLKYFNIGHDKMPINFIKTYASLKIAAAKANCDAKKITEKEMNLIIQAAQEIIDGQHNDQFPLSIWQTGSGTQTNMNVNEVIANRANEISGQAKGSKSPISPNDHVNLSQSTNDSFPTAIHICAYQQTTNELLPALQKLIDCFANKAKSFKDIIKIGRTHLQDATPLTLQQEFSGFVALLERCQKRIIHALDGLLELAIGGTAVGTGINAPEDFSQIVCQHLENMLNIPFRPHPNKFAALSSHDEIVHLAGALDNLAGALLKIAYDIRWMSSGPRCGINELDLPQNEPGSSIMPGKVNPTQCEAMTMVAVQVKSYCHAISFAGSQGNFQLNVYKPLFIHNMYQSLRLLTDSMLSFGDFCIEGIEPNIKRIDQLMTQSLMLVTALTPKIGYYKAAEIAQHALKHHQTLKASCLELGYLDEQTFDEIVDPKKMV